MTTTQKEIERLVNERPMKDSKDLFRAKLEYLVLIAQREQLIADRDATKKIIDESYEKSVKK